MKALYFIRHGESEDNAAGIWSRPDTPLTQTGRKQAVLSGQTIKKQGLQIDLILTSELPRATESAQIIAAQIGYPLSKIKRLGILNERDFGPLTGTKGDGSYDGGPKALAEADKVQGFEKTADLQVRAGKALEVIQSMPETNILIVGHGTFARAMRRVINNQPYTDEYAPDLVRFKHGEVSQLI